MSGLADESAPLMLSVSGLRGLTGRSFTPDVAARFARALVGLVRDGSGAGAPTIVFGRDGRANAEPLRDAAAQALAGAGCRVIDLGVATTPTVGVMVDHARAQAGLILTASHNPGEWNGLKALVVGPGSLGAHAPDAALAERLIARFHAEPAQAPPPAGAPASSGRVETNAGAAKTHVDLVLQALSEIASIEAIRARRFRVVVDSVNASGATAARLLLEALGCQITHVHADGSGVFPHAPEPTRENLAGLRAAALAANAEIAFAQDPDADRLAILDERGEYIGEECTLVFAARAVGGARRKDASRAPCFAANLSTSRMIDDVASAMGGSVARTPVGEANVVAAMHARGCALGGEGNGGVIWPRVCWVRDSIGAMALTLALMTREAKPVSRLVADTPAYAIEKRKVDVRPGLASRACEAIAGRWAPEPGARIDTQDGVRVDLPDGAWLHVRASNTEPIIRLIAEALSAPRRAELLDEASRLIAGL